MDREYLKRVVLYVFVSVLAIGVIVYVGVHMVRGFTADIETQTAYIDTFSESVTLDAYIMRHEEVVGAGADGTVNYLVGDGEKVAVGDEVADICRGGAGGIRERIAEIDAQIKRLEAVQSGARYSSVSDATNIEANIRELTVNVSRRVAEGDIASASVASAQLLSELCRHDIVTGKIDGFDGEIASLRAERESLTSQLTDVARTIVTDKSAYFFYDVDGYEDAFAFDDIDEVTLDDIYAMTEASVKTGSDAIGKLVTDYMWYAAVTTDRRTALYFTEGKSYDIMFGSEGVTLPMMCSRVLTVKGTDDESRAAVIFACSVMPEDFSYTRMQPVTVTVQSYEGYRVPISAVRVVKYGDDDVNGVYILYGQVVYFRRIEIVLSQDGYVLCDSHADETVEVEDYAGFPEVGDGGVVKETEPPETEKPPEYASVPFLQLYDQVIVSARGLYDGKIVGA